MQLQFLSADDGGDFSRGRAALDAESSLILVKYHDARLEAGASLASVKREASMLRVLARQLQPKAVTVSLVALLGNPVGVAALLAEPPDTAARSTVGSRLVALVRLVTIVGPEYGRDPDNDIATIDRCLPRGLDRGWHRASIGVGGTTARRRRKGPVLEVNDIERIISGAAHGRNGPRNQLLVALSSLSGLRPQEIVSLRWEDFSSVEIVSAGIVGRTVDVLRNGRTVRLPLVSTIRDALDAYATSEGSVVQVPMGPVFMVSRRKPRALGYPAAREIVRRACVCAGYPPIESAELRAAYAHWLRSQGLSDHEIAEVLGLSRVKSVDRRVHRHAQLDAQRRVREVLDR